MIDHLNECLWLQSISESIIGSSLCVGIPASFSLRSNKDDVVWSSGFSEEVNEFLAFAATSVQH